MNALLKDPPGTHASTIINRCVPGIGKAARLKNKPATTATAAAAPDEYAATSFF